MRCIQKRRARSSHKKILAPFFFAAGFIPAYFAKRWEPTVSTTVRLDQNSPLVTFGL